AARNLDSKQPSKQEMEVITCGGQHGVNGIAGMVCKIDRDGHNPRLNVRENLEMGRLASERPMCRSTASLVIASISSTRLKYIYGCERLRTGKPPIVGVTVYAARAALFC